MGRTIVNGACVIRDGSGDAESSVPESGRGGARGEEGGGHVTPGCYSKQPGLPPSPGHSPPTGPPPGSSRGPCCGEPRPRAAAPPRRALGGEAGRAAWPAGSSLCGPRSHPASSPSRVTSLGPPPPAVLPALLPPPAGAGRPQMPARVLLTRLPRHDTVAGRPRQQLCSSRLSGLEGQGQATGCGPGGRPLLAWTMLPSSCVLTWPFKVPVVGGRGGGREREGTQAPCVPSGHRQHRGAPPHDCF